MNKILLLGSAPYIKDWFARNGQRYIEDGHKLCALNNAWAVAPDKLKVWIRAEDFFCTENTVKPTHEQRQSWYEVVKTKDVPISYSRGRTGGTMLLNAICHFINLSFESKQKLWLSVAGCDLIYKGNGADWFYGKGDPDPLFFGKDFIVEELRRLVDIAEYFSYTLVNVGGQAESLLPFAKYSL